MAVSEKEREAVILRLEGKTYEEIGEAMGLTRSDAYWMVERAIKRSVAAKVHVKTVYPSIAEKMEGEKMTKRRLAKKTGITESDISLILRGYKDIRLSTARKIANALGMTIDKAFREEE